MWTLGPLWDLIQKTIVLALIMGALLYLKDRSLPDLLRATTRRHRLPKGWAQRGSAGLLLLALTTSALGWIGQAMQYGLPAIIAMALGGPASHEIDGCHKTTPGRRYTLGGSGCMYGGKVTTDRLGGRLYCSKHGYMPNRW